MDKCSGGPPTPGATEQRRRRNQKFDQRARGSSFANMANTIRSAGAYRGRATCRRTTIN